MYEELRPMIDNTNNELEKKVFGQKYQSSRSNQLFIKSENKNKCIN